MNHFKTQVFADLTKRHLEGDSAALDSLKILTPKPEEGYCLFNAYEEWSGAFSFIPGRLEALPLIASLANKIVQYTTDDTLRMYAEPEWKKLVAMRGPFDCSIRYTCRDCKSDYIGFGQSGFDDRSPAVCNMCGDVWLQSAYDESPLPRCGCSGDFFVSGCPNCRSNKIENKIYFSSYEYFKDHTWKEKDA